MAPLAGLERPHLRHLLDSGGTAVDSGDYFLRRADDRNEPPFTCVEINLGGSAAFSSGSTHQRAIGITGLWGYANTESPAGTLSGSLTANATSAAVTGQAAAALGAGSVIRVGSERMRVTGRTMTDTGQTLATDIDKQVATALVPVADASGYAVDETILIDAERMLIVDIAGSNLIVKRAWDGTANATHSTGAVIYGLRSLTVARGELGTTAAAHSSADAVNRWDPPGLVQDLAIAEAISRLTSETAGYTRALRSGEGSSERNRDQNALKSLRESVYVAHGRKARIRAV